VVIDSQFIKIQELQREKTRLRTFIFKYEAELKGWEQNGAAPLDSSHDERMQLAQSQSRTRSPPHAHNNNPNVSSATSALSVSFAVENA
jgi:hypothetical protein